MKQEHYYTKNPQSQIKQETIIQDELLGNKLTFISASGLFSLQQIDIGSKILIEHSDVKNCQSLLDLGCGYGPIGISIKKAHPQIKVTFSDVNGRAISYTNKNLKKNNVTGITIQSNKFQNIQQTFDCILLNPPHSAGKKLCEELITDSFLHLNAKGTLQIVARKNKGGASLAKHMESIFGNVTPIGKKSGYWVYLSQKNI